MKHTGCASTARIREPLTGRRAEFGAPIGSVERGELVLPTGAARLELRAEPRSGELFRARFERTEGGAKLPLPEVRAERGRVTVAYPRVQGSQRRRAWPTCAGEVVLNASVPWAIEIGASAHGLVGDLTGVRLSSFTLREGGSEIALILPVPVGTIEFAASGRLDVVRLIRPRGTAARVDLDGGASELRLDDRRWDAVRDRLRWRSTGYEDAPDRYHIVVAGGANDLLVGTEW